MSSEEILLDLLGKYKLETISKITIIDLLKRNYGMVSCVDRQEVLDMLTAEAQVEKWPVMYDVKKLIDGIKV